MWPYLISTYALTAGWCHANIATKNSADSDFSLYLWSNPDGTGKYYEGVLGYPLRLYTHYNLLVGT
jgi:hypothetical protein